MCECRIAIIGAGDMASYLSCALAALPYYYDHRVPVVRSAVVSTTPARRRAFAERFGFATDLSPEDFWKRDDIDTVFIAGPNRSHFPHLLGSLRMGSVNNIYLEKPICASHAEEEQIARLLTRWPAGKTVQTGFQFLQMGAVRQALKLIRKGGLGEPIHFHARYLHSGYLQQSYRDRKRSRLEPAPAGGAATDLGSHGLSLLATFVGEDLEVVAARSNGAFTDVPAGSDLCTAVLLREDRSGAVGTLLASRISFGAGDLLELEVRYTGGALRLTTERPDFLEWFDPKLGGWTSYVCGSDYTPQSSFPSRQAPAGWLRSLVHALYLFLGGVDPDAVVPDLRHGLVVQRLIRRAAGAAGLPSSGG